MMKAIGTAIVFAVVAVSLAACTTVTDMKVRGKQVYVTKTSAFSNSVEACDVAANGEVGQCVTVK